MGLNFKQACSATADIFEALPETWMQGDEQDDGGYPDGMGGFLHPDTPQYCAIGGVAAAMGLNEAPNSIHEQLDIVVRKFPKYKSKYNSIVGLNDNDVYDADENILPMTDEECRLAVIDVLRVAAGECVPPKEERVASGDRERKVGARLLGQRPSN